MRNNKDAPGAFKVLGAFYIYRGGDATPPGVARQLNPHFG